MKSHLHTTITVISSVLIAFLGLYFAGKYILPDITGEAGTVITKESTEAGAIVGSRAPQFNLRDVLGNHVRLSDYAGAPTVVIFWATWNKESADQIKIIDDYVRDYADRAGLIHIVAINSQEDPTIVSSFIRRGGYSVPTLLDTFGDVSTSYAVHSLPDIFFIGKDGVIRETGLGIVSERIFVEKVENLLKPSSVQ